MIPPSLWAQSGKKNLAPSDWDRVRQRVYAADHRCEICGGVGTRHAVEAAERWAYDDDTLVQRLIGISALCPTCHLATTPGRAAMLAEEQPDLYADLPEQVRQHLATVNGWSLAVTDAYLDWSYAVHRLRAAHTWTSDWTYFARVHGVGEGVLSTEAVCQRCFCAVPLRRLDEDGICADCR